MKEINLLKKELARLQVRAYQRRTYGPRKRNPLGVYGEFLGLKLIPGSKLVRKVGHDLKVPGGLRYEVKTSAKHQISAYAFSWSFKLVKKQIRYSHYHIFFCIGGDGVAVEKTYCIPNFLLKNRHILSLGATNQRIFEAYQIENPVI